MTPKRRCSFFSLIFIVNCISKFNLIRIIIIIIIIIIMKLNLNDGVLLLTTYFLSYIVYTFRFDFHTCYD